MASQNMPSATTIRGWAVVIALVGSFYWIDNQSIKTNRHALDTELLGKAAEAKKSSAANHLVHLVPIHGYAPATGSTLNGPQIPTYPPAETLTRDWNKYRDTVLAVGGVDQLLRTFDIRNLKGGPVAVLRGHEDAVRKLVWSPHLSDVLISGSYDISTGAQAVPDRFQGDRLLRRKEDPSRQSHLRKDKRRNPLRPSLLRQEEFKRRQENCSSKLPRYYNVHGWFKVTDDWTTTAATISIVRFAISGTTTLFVWAKKMEYFSKFKKLGP